MKSKPPRHAGGTAGPNVRSAVLQIEGSIWRREMVREDTKQLDYGEACVVTTGCRQDHRVSSELDGTGRILSIQVGGPEVRCINWHISWGRDASCGAMARRE